MAGTVNARMHTPAGVLVGGAFRPARLTRSGKGTGVREDHAVRELASSSRPTCDYVIDRLHGRTNGILKRSSPPTRRRIRLEKAS